MKFTLMTSAVGALSSVQSSPSSTNKMQFSCSTPKVSARRAWMLHASVTPVRGLESSTEMPQQAVRSHQDLRDR